MTVSLSELARLVDGKLTGDGDIQISGAAILRDARAGEITLADSAAAAGRLTACSASAVVVPSGVAADRLPQIHVDDPHEAFARIVAYFRPPQTSSRPGVSPQAIISPSAVIGTNVDIFPGATVGDDVVIGDGCTIHSGVRVMAGCKLAEDVVLFPNVVLYENTVIGPRVVIHATVTIGAYGFGYETVDGRHQRTAQLGYVEIEADVEIGAGSTIDRGTYGPTIIGEGTKIDNLVMIGHNCRIGRHNILCSQVGIAGSCTTGDYVIMAGQVGLSDHLDIGHGARLGAKSGHMTDVPAGASFFGSPATHSREQLRMIVAQRKLPELRKTISELQQQVERLSCQVESQRKADAA